jgi:hypothetical protein
MSFAPLVLFLAGKSSFVKYCEDVKKATFLSIIIQKLQNSLQFLACAFFSSEVCEQTPRHSITDDIRPASCFDRVFFSKDLHIAIFPDRQIIFFPLIEILRRLLRGHPYKHIKAPCKTKKGGKYHEEVANGSNNVCPELNDTFFTLR